jgi:hypothetical protein
MSLYLHSYPSRKQGCWQILSLWPKANSSPVCPSRNCKEGQGTQETWILCLALLTRSAVTGFQKGIASGTTEPAACIGLVRLCIPSSLLTNSSLGAGTRSHVWDADTLKCGHDALLISELSALIHCDGLAQLRFATTCECPSFRSLFTSPTSDLLGSDW